MIAFQCPGCAKKYNVKDSLGGRKTKCLKCHVEFRIPQNPAHNPSQFKVESATARPAGNLPSTTGQETSATADSAPVATSNMGWEEITEGNLVARQSRPKRPFSPIWIAVIGAGVLTVAAGLIVVAVGLWLVMGNDKYRQAEAKLNAGDVNGALGVAAQAPDDPKAQALINRVASKSIVVKSEPAGLPVYLAPFDTLLTGFKSGDEPSSFATAYGDVGIPASIGAKKYFVGFSPVAIDPPKADQVLCIVQEAQAGKSIDAERIADGLRGQFPYGRMSMKLTAVGTFTPADGTVLIWSNRDETFGQIQILKGGELQAVVRFAKLEPGKNKAGIENYKFSAAELYQSLAKRGFDIRDLK